MLAQKAGQELHSNLTRLTTLLKWKNMIVHQIQTLFFVERNMFWEIYNCWRDRYRTTYISIYQSINYIYISIIYIRYIITYNYDWFVLLFSINPSWYCKAIFPPVKKLYIKMKIKWTGWNAKWLYMQRARKTKTTSKRGKQEINKRNLYILCQ